MDDYDGIHNCNSLKYSPSECLTTFDSFFLRESKYKIKKYYSKD
jgi:hypothetical protein